MKNKLKAFLMVGIFLIAQSGGAGGRMELESAYLGDGWFQYRLAKPANPTYWSVDISSFAVTITNMVEYGPEPVDWTNRLDSGMHWACWDFNRAMFPQVRPYQRDFLVRSSQRNYRMARSSVAMIGVKLVSQWFTYYVAGGYVTFECLIPCAPEFSDGSPTNMMSGVDLAPDLMISRLFATNDLVYGFEVDWWTRGTVLLQGSFDCSHWTNVALIWTGEGQTIWRTNQPLNDYGKFFRLELVAVNRYLTNLPTVPAQRPSLLSAKAVNMAKNYDEQPPALTFRPQGDDVVVRFSSQLGWTYSVQANNLDGKSVAERSVSGTGEEIEIRFKAAGLPNPVFFSVATAP